MYFFLPPSSCFFVKRKINNQNRFSQHFLSPADPECFSKASLLSSVAGTVLEVRLSSISPTEMHQMYVSYLERSPSLQCLFSVGEAEGGKSEREGDREREREIARERDREREMGFEDRGNEWHIPINQGQKVQPAQGCCHLDPIEEMCLYYYFLVHATRYSCLQTDGKHIFNLHYDRQSRDKGRLRGLNDFKPVGFEWKVAAASVGLCAALRPMLFRLINCFLLASDGSPWPVVPLHLDLGPSFNAVEL